LTDARRLFAKGIFPKTHAVGEMLMKMLDNEAASE